MILLSGTVLAVLAVLLLLSVVSALLPGRILVLLRLLGFLGRGLLNLCLIVLAFLLRRAAVVAELVHREVAVQKRAVLFDFNAHLHL